MRLAECIGDLPRIEIGGGTSTILVVENARISRGTKDHVARATPVHSPTLDLGINLREAFVITSL